MNLRHKLYLKKEKLKRRVSRVGTGFCTVLLYHRVRNTDYDPQKLSVSVETFDAQLSFLKKNYHFINVDTFNERLKSNKPFKKNSLLITFDDGYADNYINALPILEKHKLQSVFYISTRNLNTADIFWWDELDEVFRNPKEINQQVLELLLKNHQKNSVTELYNYFVTELKTARSLQARDGLMGEVRQLKRLTEETLEQHRCLSYNELKNLSLSPEAVIGAHTKNHLSLAHIAAEDQDFEIKSSIVELGNLLNKPVELFSYPYGEKHNYDENCIRICKEAGLEHAAANYLGYVVPSSNLFAFPRFVVRNDSPHMLDKKLKSIL